MSLELRYDYAQPPRLLQDGKEIKGVRLVVVEADPEGVTVQIELKPFVSTQLDNGTLHWVVGCPNCEYNSVHTCVVDDDIEPEERRKVEAYDPIVEVKPA